MLPPSACPSGDNCPTLAYQECFSPQVRIEQDNQLISEIFDPVGSACRHTYTAFMAIPLAPTTTG